MIVVEDRGQLRLITQPDHARFAAQLLSLWHRPELRQHARRDLLIEAVREHDNGWREADAAPRIDASTGRPHDFRTLPGGPRRELWHRAVERFAGQAPYTALLIAQHSWELHQDRRDGPGWADFLDRLHERRMELLAAAGLDGVDLSADYRWLELADTLSLAACGGRGFTNGAPIVRNGLTARLRNNDLEIEPFPLAGATTFEVPCRWIADRRYRGEADLATALASARWTKISIRCKPSSTSL